MAVMGNEIPLFLMTLLSFLILNLILEFTRVAPATSYNLFLKNAFISYRHGAQTKCHVIPSRDIKLQFDARKEIK